MVSTLAARDDNRNIEVQTWRPRRSIWSHLLSWLTFEFLLRRYANGGAMIAARAFISGLLFYALVTKLGLWLYPPPSGSLKQRVFETLPWLGAMVGGTYAVLYARFASQWAYLSGVYDQIKAAECTGCPNSAALAEWRAAFIESCDELHLARKQTFAAIISTWGRLEQVKAAFCCSAPGGRRRLQALLAAADAVSDLDDDASASERVAGARAESEPPS